MILDGRKIKKIELEKLEIIRRSIDNPLSLAIIQIGTYPENNLYLKQKKKIASQLNIEIKDYLFQQDSQKEEIINLIKDLNQDQSITGIMLQKPIPSHFDSEQLLAYIKPEKDVEGLTEKNQAQILDSNAIIPCTAKSVLRMLEETKISLHGKRIAIIGKSLLVGKPLFQILSLTNHVTLCDTKTKNITTIIQNSEIIVVAVGKPNFITEKVIGSNQIIIDVGTNYVDDKLVGDVDFKHVAPHTQWITPVPGGVGQLTPIYLFSNLIQLYYLQKSLKIDSHH